MSERVNGIASADDFRRLAEAEAFEPEEDLILPKSGFRVRVRRPRLKAYSLIGAPLPKGLAFKLAAAESVTSVDLTREEQAALAVKDAEVMCASIVAPKFSLEPTPAEVNPNWLPVEDAAFLFQYIRGEMRADGSRLETFPGPGGPVAAGAGGGGVPDAPERDPERPVDRLAN